jgi:hypothetical protein
VKRAKLIPEIGIIMTAIEEHQLKGIFKSAVIEVLEERPDLLRDAMRESFEDMAMLHAIHVGEKSPLVGGQRIFRRLERAPLPVDSCAAILR